MGAGWRGNLLQGLTKMNNLNVTPSLFLTSQGRLYPQYIFRGFTESIGQDIKMFVLPATSKRETGLIFLPGC